MEFLGALIIITVLYMSWGQMKYELKDVGNVLKYLFQFIFLVNIWNVNVSSTINLQTVTKAEKGRMWSSLAVTELSGNWLIRSMLIWWISKSRLRWKIWMTGTWGEDGQVRARGWQGPAVSWSSLAPLPHCLWPAVSCSLGDARHSLSSGLPPLATRALGRQSGRGFQLTSAACLFLGILQYIQNSPS